MANTIKLLFNPATQRLQYNAVTKRVVVLDMDCTFCDCGEMPNSMVLTLSKFADVCNSCYRVGTYFVWRNASGTAAAVNALELTLPFQLTCRYRKNYTGNFGKIEHYSDSGCTVKTGEWVWDRLYVIADLEATGVMITIVVYDSVNLITARLFNGKALYVGDESCGKVAAVAINDLYPEAAGCYSATSGFTYVCGDTGEVAIARI